MFYSEQTVNFLITTLETLALLFVFALALGVLAAMVMREKHQ